VLTWSRGSIGVVGLVFQGDDPGLTNVGRFDSADSAISANDAT
jgi:hypothetical protein